MVIAEEIRSVIVSVVKEKSALYGGTLLFGSSIEKKLGRPSKDIDTVGLSLAPLMFTGVHNVGALTIELFIRRIDKICLSIVGIRDFFDTRNVAAGKVIDYPDEKSRIFPKLKRIAEVNWPRGPLRPGRACRGRP